MAPDMAVDELMAELSVADEPTVAKPGRLRRMPQESQIGKRYKDRAAFEEDLALHAQEKAQHDLDYKAWRAQQDRARDRSERDRSGRVQPSGAQNRRRYDGDPQRRVLTIIPPRLFLVLPPVIYHIYMNKHGVLG